MGAQRPYTIDADGVWTPETGPTQARILLGRIA